MKNKKTIDYVSKYWQLHDAIIKLNNKYANSISRFNVGDIIKHKGKFLLIDIIKSENENSLVERIIYLGRRLKKVKGIYYFLKSPFSVVIDEERIKKVDGTISEK